MDETEIATMILKLKLIKQNLKSIYTKKKKQLKKLENSRKRGHKRHAPSAMRRNSRQIDDITSIQGRSILKSGKQADSRSDLGDDASAFGASQSGISRPKKKKVDSSTAHKTRNPGGSSFVDGESGDMRRSGNGIQIAHLDNLDSDED